MGPIDTEEPILCSQPPQGKVFVITWISLLRRFHGTDLFRNQCPTSSLPTLSRMRKSVHHVLVAGRFMFFCSICVMYVRVCICVVCGHVCLWVCVCARLHASMPAITVSPNVYYMRTIHVRPYIYIRVAYDDYVLGPCRAERAGSRGSQGCALEAASSALRRLHSLQLFLM